MIAVGYLAKRVVQRPDWLKAPTVKDIYSVSSCISGNFMDYIRSWRHNGYWLFDNQEIIRELALENRVELENLTFFYYEVYEQEFDEESKQWSGFEPEAFPTNVIPPIRREFHGCDVVTFSAGTNPECSPLSCNHLAGKINTNSHCLFDTFEEARKSLESGKFVGGEPGPFRIFAVYTLDATH